MQTTFTVIATLAAVVSAVAAIRANSHAKESDRSAQRASLLSRVPLPVPWVENSETRLLVVNRGASSAHNLHWAITVDGEQLAGDEHKRVLNPGSSTPLTDSQHAIVARVSVAHEFVISCDFSTSWGDRFTVRRSYLDGKIQEPVLLDGHGEQLTLLDK